MQQAQMAAQQQQQGQIPQQQGSPAVQNLPQPATPQMQQQPPPPIPQQQPQQPPQQQPQQPNGAPNIMSARPPIGFPVLNNLHIPQNKQKKLQQTSQSPQSAAPSPGGPQVRPNIALTAAAVAAAAQGNTATAQRLFQQGIPIAPTAGSPIRPTGAPQFQSQPGQPVTPALILSDLDRKGSLPQAQPAPTRPTNEVSNGTLDRSASLLSRTTWAPSEESDIELRNKLFELHTTPARTAVRATLLEGLSTVPPLANVLGESLPPELRALADADAESKSELDLKSKKHDLEGSGMPGQKKQKVQDLAKTVDKTMEIPRPVEDVMLHLTDEYVDILSEMSCQLAKHRQSSTIDRKDVQFAYESLFGRSLPGFSSDAIRLDQARASRRVTTQQRAAKLKLVNDAKAAWRREKDESVKAAEAAVQASIAAQAAAALGISLPTESVGEGAVGAGVGGGVGGEVPVPGVGGVPGLVVEIPNGTLNPSTPIDVPPSVIVSAPPVVAV